MVRGLTACGFAIVAAPWRDVVLDQERLRRRREEKILKELENARRTEGEESPTVQRLLEEKNALLHERQKDAAAR